ncbi:MAG: NAD(P)H-hydrate dehydratase [Gammaproteobacteria bacterium]|nr:NAD(P)H-hydrate dehydratase [Gammaproteobacteria bacterium]
MPTLPYSLYRGEQIRALDHYAIHTGGVSGTVLMERAGSAAFNELRRRWIKATRIIVVCGIGNNGGDGFVLARLAKEADLDVRVVQVGDINRLHGDSLAALQRLQNLDVRVEPFGSIPLIPCDVLVDALLGTGLKGEVRGQAAQAIAVINQSGQAVLALDMPSGLDADSGMPRGLAVHAHCTVSFLGLKRGLFTGDGPNYSGSVVFHDLNVPDATYQQQIPQVERIDYARFKSLLKPRARQAHKGYFGRVLIIGGEQGFTGAARLAGEAALRCGAGLVSLATRHAHAAVLNATRPELMVHGVEDDKAFQTLAERASVIAIGPGLGQGPWAKQLFDLAMESGLPLVVDADALNLLAQQPSLRSQWVLTPHEGEAARLLGRASHEVHEDRFDAVMALQKNFGGVVVLKGAGSLIASADLPLWLCSEGNPGMASGGMGDVLTGTIAGLIAQKFDLLAAAQLGVVLHAAAADAAAKAAGERGLLASDLMSWLRRLINPA